MDDDPVRRVNALGLLCPLPLLRTAEAMRSVSAGDLVEVLSDDSGILEDLPEWCDETGHILISLEKVNGHWRGLVRKNGSAPD